MSLYRDSQLPELYELKHRHDNNENDAFDIENNILKKTLSNFLFNNDTMNEFLLKMQKLYYLWFDQINIIRNLKNWTVDKYYNNHVD
jgi:hypothetical protein